MKRDANDVRNKAPVNFSTQYYDNFMFAHYDEI